MITLIILTLVLLIGVPALIFTMKNLPKDRFNEPTTFKPIYKWVTFLVVGTLVALVQPYSTERIDAGNIGLKTKLIGSDRGVGKYEYVTGYVFYNSWFETVNEFPTFQQHIDYEENVVITRGGFQTTIKPSFNYSLIPGQVGDMFVSLRRPLKQIEQEWLKTAIVGAVNDVANTWSVDDIFNNREKFESDIIMEAKKRTAKWFLLSQLRTNITPPKALQASIEAKTKAIQEVQVAENQKKVAEAEAQRKIAVAKGDSAQAVIAAAGEANAMKLKQRELSSQYIEYIKWSKWNGTLPSTMLGSGSNTMFSINK
jgi:regulator of protease activity HflC (stomatin/prohibitin superfamily)